MHKERWSRRCLLLSLLRCMLPRRIWTSHSVVQSTSPASHR
jgi:hypothetical protein